MIPVSAELAAAIADPERVPSYRVLCDWDRDGLYSHEYSDISGYVQAVKLNRGCATFSPNELNLANGYSSGEITLDLGGQRDTSAEDGLTAYELFGGGPTVSPLWGQSTLGVRMQVFVAFQTPDGVEETPYFAGWIREAPVSRKARTVQLVANDNTDMVNAQVTLPLWAVATSSPYASWTNGNPDAARSILLSWVWEEILRQCGRPVAPLLRSDCQAHYSCSGSLLPSVGHITDAWATGPYVQAASFVPEGYAVAPFGYATPRTTVRGSEGHCNTRDRIIVPMIPNTGNTPTSVSFGVWVQTDANDTTGDSMSYMVFLENTNLADDVTQQDNRARVVMTVTANGALASAAVSGQPSSGSPTYNRADSSSTRSGWHYYSATVDIAATSITHRLYIDGQQVSQGNSGNTGQLSFSAAGSGYVNDNRTNLVRLVTKLPTHHAQVWARPVADGAARFVQPSQLSVPVQDNGAPYVSMTRSLTELSWIPDTYFAPGWDTLKDTVGAEWGALWIDARGTVHVVNRPTINATATDSIGLDNPTYHDDVVGEITLTPRADSKRNAITIPGRFRNAVEKIVWTNQNALDYWVQAGVYVNGIRYPLTEITAVVQRLSADDATPPSNDSLIDVRKSHATAVKAQDVNTAASQGWAFNLVQDHDQRSFYLSLHANAEDDFIGSFLGGNRPSLMVAGRSYSDTQVIQTTVTDTGDVASYGRATWTAEESDWRQTSASINALAQNMITTLTEGTIGISDVDLPHDPSRELFDVIVLANDAGEGLGALAVQVMGIDSTLDKSGFRDTLSLRLLHRPGVAMWDDVSAGWETAWSA